MTTDTQINEDGLYEALRVIDPEIGMNIMSWVWFAMWISRKRKPTSP